MKLNNTKLNGVYYRESDKRKYNNKPDKCFYIKYYINKKQKQECLGWLSEGMSAQLAAQIRNERVTSGFIQKTLKLDDAYNLYIEWAMLNKRSWKDDKLRYEKHIKPVFGSVFMDKITSSEMNSFFVKLKGIVRENGKHYSAQTIKHIYNLVNRLYSFMIELGEYTAKNPVENIKLERFDNVKISYLSEKEIVSFFKVCKSNVLKKNDADLLLFALYTGLRRSELFNLEWKNIDIKNRVLFLIDTKSKKNHSILLSDIAVDLLKEMEQTDIYVFPSSKGGKRDNVKKLWEKVKSIAGIREHIRFHDLRHTFGTIAVSSGIGIDVVQKMMTHSNIKTTQRYAHIVDNRINEAANTMNNVFSNLSNSDENTCPHTPKEDKR